MLRSDSTTAPSMNGNVVRTKPLDAMYVVGPVQRIAELRVNRQQSSAEDPDSIHCAVAPSSPSSRNDHLPAAVTQALCPARAVCAMTSVPVSPRKRSPLVPVTA